MPTSRSFTRSTFKGRFRLTIILLPILLAILVACGDNTATSSSSSSSNTIAQTSQVAAPLTVPATTTTTTPVATSTTSQVQSQSTTTAPTIASTVANGMTNASINSAQPVTKAQVGFIAPDFTAKTLGGETLQLSQLRGKAVLLNFWATYCPYCRQETPDLLKAYTNNKDKLSVVGINWKENESEILTFVNQFKITYPVVLDKAGTLITQYRAPSHPYSVFIDKTGLITAIVPGLLTPQALQSLLTKTLGAGTGAEAGSVATTPSMTPISGSTTAAVTSPVALVLTNPPSWFSSVPTYDKAQPIPFDATAVAGLGLNPTQYYATGAISSDSVATIANFYAPKLTPQGWQKVEQTPIVQDDLGQQVYFTRTVENTRQVVQIVVLSKAALEANPATKPTGDKLPDGVSLIVTIAYNG